MQKGFCLASVFHRHTREQPQHRSLVGFHRPDRRPGKGQSPGLTGSGGSGGFNFSDSWSLQELPLTCPWPSCSKPISLESPKMSKGEAPASPKVARELILCFRQAVCTLWGANSHLLACHMPERAGEGNDQWMGRLSLTCQKCCWQDVGSRLEF